MWEVFRCLREVHLTARGSHAHASLWGGPRKMLCTRSAAFWTGALRVFRLHPRRIHQPLADHRADAACAYNRHGPVPGLYAFDPCTVRRRRDTEVRALV